ncbi:uncharacterized protein LOC143363556 [Halictus rubicundus]|uniref:uncharacterized protein LOC143363154 n=1 Tax=Halictus rubicundus TaxID=77578 RepID=UPI0040365350
MPMESPPRYYGPEVSLELRSGSQVIVNVECRETNSMCPSRSYSSRNSEYFCRSISSFSRLLSDDKSKRTAADRGTPTSVPGVATNAPRTSANRLGGLVQAELTRIAPEVQRCHSSWMRLCPSAPSRRAFEQLEEYPLVRFDSRGGGDHTHLPPEVIPPYSESGSPRRPTGVRGGAS